jgi:hypothetical protein
VDAWEDSRDEVLVQDLSNGGDMTERWLPCVGYEGRYAVSDLGRVYSIPRKFTKGCYLRPATDRNGYLVVGLDGKTQSVHRLVALAFHGDKKNVLHNEVSHLDGVKSNARADNLKWVSKRENASHKVLHGTAPRGERAPNVKLTANQVHQIRASTEGPGRLAAMFGVSPGHIWKIRRYDMWRHLASPKPVSSQKAG